MTREMDQSVADLFIEQNEHLKDQGRRNVFALMLYAVDSDTLFKLTDLELLKETNRQFLAMFPVSPLKKGTQKRATMTIGEIELYLESMSDRKKRKMLNAMLKLAPGASTPPR